MGATPTSIRVNFETAAGDDWGKTGQYIYRVAREAAGNFGKQGMGSPCDASAGACELTGLTPNTPYRPVVFACRTPRYQSPTTIYCGTPSAAPQPMQTEDGDRVYQRPDPQNQFNEANEFQPNNRDSGNQYDGGRRGGRYCK